MRTIENVLQRAKEAQNVKSDYKLALCIGIGETALANYRHGRSLPDEKACRKLALCMGEDPAILTVQMQARRSKDKETRELWESIAARLQKGFADVQMMAMLAMFLVAACALVNWASALPAFFEWFQSVYYVNYRARHLTPPAA